MLDVFQVKLHCLLLLVGGQFAKHVRGDVNVGLHVVKEHIDDVLAPLLLVLVFVVTLRHVVIVMHTHH